MVYTILISVVFIAELIIAIAVIQNLIKLDKILLEFDGTISETKSGITDIVELIHKISEQWVILAQDFVEKTKRNSEDLLLKRLSKLMMSILVFNLNFKLVKKLRKSRLMKTLSKGWSFLESMV